MTTLTRLLLAGVALAALAPSARAQTPSPDPTDPSPDRTPDPITSDPATDRTSLDPIHPVRPPPDPIQTPVSPGDSGYYGDPDYPTGGAALDRLGFSLSAGGGVSGFTDSSLRDTTSDGGLWDLRATLGTRSWLALEASYIGSAQTIDALGLDSDALLISNGVQGALRLNMLPRGEVQPFLFAGAAWRRYDVTNTATNTSDIADQDDVFEIPMGIGVSYRLGGLVLDARGELRAATDEDLMPSLTSTDPDTRASMHRYGVNANLGVEF